MEAPHAAGELIIVCGLTGSGKTTHALALEAAGGVVRFSPDEWLQALDLDLWDAPRRARVEALQWQLAQALLAVGVTVVIEWGAWGRLERDTLRLGATRGITAGPHEHSQLFRQSWSITAPRRSNST